MKIGKRNFQKQPFTVVLQNGVLKNFAVFTGKHLQASNFIKKRFQNMCFPVNIAKFLRTASFIEHLRWLLLKVLGLICSTHYNQERLLQRHLKDDCQKLEELKFFCLRNANLIFCMNIALTILLLSQIILVNVVSSSNILKVAKT